MYRARASQVFEPNFLIDPAELRSESSVEKLEMANAYLKEMAYKKVRDLGVCDDTYVAQTAKATRCKKGEMHFPYPPDDANTLLVFLEL